jgi:CDP-glucose 4,6-dehydratase
LPSISRYITVSRAALGCADEDPQADVGDVDNPVDVSHQPLTGPAVHRDAVMSAFNASFWRDRKIFVTGHTGFKGAWLTLWLTALGARVTGFSLPPHTDPSLFTLCARGRATDLYGDIADPALLARVLKDAKPEIVIHMAAQALVRRSYADPLGTYATNVMGTANLLQAIRAVPSVRAAIVVTSDKVYDNDGAGRPFVEDDRLGGPDPYSSSKACAELVARSFRQCFFADACPIVTARAGNVVGGGDWSPFRIVHDVVEAAEAGRAVVLRYPRAVRSWQHVLDPLAGYLMLAQAMVAAPGAVPAALNFGPEADCLRPVSELVEALAVCWGGRPPWRADTGEHPHEAALLALDATRARQLLGWRPLLSFNDSVRWTADWYRAFWNGEDIGAVTRRQIAVYCERLGQPVHCSPFEANHVG